MRIASRDVIALVLVTAPLFCACNSPSSPSRVASPTPVASPTRTPTSYAGNLQVQSARFSSDPVAACVASHLADPANQRTSFRASFRLSPGSDLAQTASWSADLFAMRGESELTIISGNSSSTVWKANIASQPLFTKACESAATTIYLDLLEVMIPASQADLSGDSIQGAGSVTVKLRHGPPAWDEYEEKTEILVQFDLRRQ